jgi:hypothetical protein
MRRCAIVGLLLVSWTVTSCGDSGNGTSGNTTQDEPESAGTFTLARSRCGYEGRGTTAEGLVVFELSSVGIADFDLWLLEEGHAFEELVAHIDEERRRAEAGEAPLGHPTFASLVAETSTDTTGTTTLTTRLDPGTYGMACIRNDPATGGIWAAGPFTVMSEG